MSPDLIDVRNTLKQHLIVGFLSLALAFLMHFGLGIEWSTAFGRVAFILLFIVLAIGPLMKLKKPEKSSDPLTTPWSWRGELGIWFTITAVIHALFAMNQSWINWSLSEAFGGGIGGGGLALANLLGFIALFMSLALAATSFNKVIKFLGVESWKWLQSFAYVIFYLVFGHFAYFQFFSSHAKVDWFGYTGIILGVLLIVLQFAGFVKSVRKKKK